MTSKSKKTEPSPDGTWLSVWLAKDTKKKLRLRAAVEETSMSAMAADLIAAAINPPKEEK